MAHVLAALGRRERDSSVQTRVGAAWAGTGGGGSRGAVSVSWILLEEVAVLPGPLGADRLGLGLLSPVSGAGRCPGLKEVPACFFSGTHSLSHVGNGRHV